MEKEFAKGNGAQGGPATKRTGHAVSLEHFYIGLKLIAP